jgi:tetratricopeptide (TPR) repeat protein
VHKYPNNAPLLWIYASFFATIGEFDLAMAVGDHLIVVDPLNPSTHNIRGSVFQIIGRLDESRQSYKRMEELGMEEPYFLASLAFDEGDAEAIQVQLDRGQTEWGNLSYVYPFYETAVAYLKDDRNRVDEILASLKSDPGSLPLLMKSAIAKLEGDIDRSLDYYIQAISESRFTALMGIQTPEHFARLFPEYRSHPGYKKMLRDVGLDEKSVAKLKIPPLPF